MKMKILHNIAAIVHVVTDEMKILANVAAVVHIIIKENEILLSASATEENQKKNLLNVAATVQLLFLISKSGAVKKIPYNY